jgi:glycosyltransferase involved in cell wall biosynthesis
MKPTGSVSVIIPVHNGGRFVSATLDSVLKQTVLPQEIIIVDDGSTDDSPRLIAEAVEARAGSVPIRVLTQENARQSAARNAAAEIATGEFLAFLDQDDAWHPQHLSVMLKCFHHQPELGWVYTDFDEVDSEGFFVTRDFIGNNHFRHPKTSVRDYLAEDAMMLPSATIVRAAALKSVGGFDPRLCGYEDDDLFLRLFRAGWHSHFVRQSLTFYRIHSSSSSSGSSFRESRLIYLQNVLSHTPDDPRMGRMYMTQLLVPRLLNTTMHEYGIALRTRNDDAARTIAGDVATIAAVAFTSRRRRIGLALLARPKLLRTLLTLRAGTPRWMRKPIPPALEIR